MDIDGYYGEKAGRRDENFVRISARVAGYGAVRRRSR
jgi:hypothetical protein